MQIYIVALDETGKAHPKEIYIDDGVSPSQVEEYLENNCIEYFTWGDTYEHMANISEAVNRNRDNELLGKFLKCKQCGKYYYLTHANIVWYDMHGLRTPKRCMACRKVNRKND